MMTSANSRIGRWEPYTGIAFVVCFIGSVVASSPPSDKASDATWIADYSGHAHQAQHLVTGVLLVLAAISLLSFMSALWRRIAAVGPDGAPSPLPLVAAGVAAACIAAGGTLMAYISGGELTGSYPLPSVDLLRMSNDLGFSLVGVPGMLAASLCVVSLSFQGRAAGVFGAGMTRFGVVVAVVLLAGFAFVPVIALLVWLLVVAVRWIRSSDQAVEAGRAQTAVGASAAG